MNQRQDAYSTQHITPQLISQIIDALKNKPYGSVEIYVENYHVVQITERTISKLNGNNQKKVSITITRGSQVSTNQQATE